MEAAHVNWAALPTDYLSCVGALLTVPARICFRAVCRTWREAILEEQARAMPAPWVIIPRVDGCTDSFVVLSAPTMNSFRWTPPGGARARCVGSNGTWLAIVTVVDVRSLAISLVNPLTDARVQLPLVTGWRWALDTEHDLEFELDVLVRKVAFSPSPSAHDYAAAYVSPCSEAVLCTRAGADRWLRLLEPVGGDHEGVRRELDVAYHDGKFYYMATSGQVWVVDMAASSSPSPVPLHVLSPPFYGMLTCRGYHLAFSGDGALHVVWSRSEGDGYPPNCNLRDMAVTRYGPDASSGEERFRPARSIVGRRAFLIGDRNQSMSVPVDNNSWLRPNSIYFTNIPLCDRFAIGRLGRRRGLWAFDVVTGRITWQRAPSGNVDRPLESEWMVWPPEMFDNKQLGSELDVDWAKSLWFMPCLTQPR